MRAQEARGTAREPLAPVQMERPQSLSRAVGESIKAAILRGVFRPGDKLVESALTASLNVSRTPLREAFRELAAEGYITLVPHRGAYVSRLTAEEVRDIYTIAGALEGLAIRLAVPRMDEGTLRRLKGLHADLRRAHRARDIDLYYATNRTYHRFISEQSGNGRLVNMIDGLRTQILKTRVLSLSVPGRLDASMREHEELLEAILARDARRAEAMLIRHLENQSKVFAELLERQEEEEAERAAGGALGEAGP